MLRRLWFAVFASVIVETVGASSYYVDPNGTSGAFRTVQAAVDAVSGQSELNRANIVVAAGRYHELVTVAKPFISFIGTGDSPDDVTITYQHIESGTGANFTWGEAVSIAPEATAFMARNISFENSTPHNSTAQALAIHSSADRAVFDNTRFLGFQDTLFADNGSRQYVRGSFITGDIDFIFGDATAVFDQCSIRSTGTGWVTAPNTARTTANGFVFLDCALFSGTDSNQVGGNGSSADTDTVYLGRPWQWWEAEKMPSAAFIRTRMGLHIKAAGWDPWDNTGSPGANPHTDRNRVTRVSEFGSMDLAGHLLLDSNHDGKPDGRVAWADVMRPDVAANYTLDHIFGPVDFWNADTQPDVGNLPYQSQGESWNLRGQLALLPKASGANCQLLNISTRATVGAGEREMIAGFIVRGSGSKQVIVRALGPSLAQAGIAGALGDPALALRDNNGALLYANDDWQESDAANIQASGVAPGDGAEAAIVTTAAAGNYTAELAGSHATTGVALLEIYDLAQDASAQLTNISTRAFVGTGNSVMIAGFILGNGSTAKVLLRALGPTLASSGVAAPLTDPTLTLFDSQGTPVAFDDDWKDAQQDEVIASGIPPTHDREAAIVATLPAGSYTAVVAGKNGETGIGLVELYALE